MTDVQLKNPTTLYYHKNFEKQQQKYPGIQAEMIPVPDCGEDSYAGCGRLKGRKALITGGDSGIGRAASHCLCARRCRCGHQLFAGRKPGCRGGEKTC